MAQENRTTLKTYFETGDLPTQSEFVNLLDSLLNLVDSGITEAEAGYLAGVTSAIQTQLDAKQDELTGLTASVTELNYTDGVTSNIQTQLNSRVRDTGDTMSGNLIFNNTFGVYGLDTLGVAQILMALNASNQILIADADTSTIIRGTTISMTANTDVNGVLSANSITADNGATGSFTAQSGVTVTVTNGIITSIV